MAVTALETEPNQFNGDFRTDFLSVDQLSVNDINELHEEADAMKWLGETRGVSDVLSGHIYTLLFWEAASTRTKNSFDFAIRRLGAQTINFDQASSSSSKGETFEDTVEMIDAYSVPSRDGIIIRHNVVGSVERAAEIAAAKVINAGDGDGEHPTQGVLDVKTIREHFDLTTVRIAFGGDVAYARTVNSTAPLLAKLGVRHMVFATPDPEFRANPATLAKLRGLGVEVEECDTFAEAAPYVDVFYALRTQYNLRFPNDKAAQAEARRQFEGKSFLTPADMQSFATRIMHALPEDQEDPNIHPELRYDQRCIVKEQAAWGQWTRMSSLVRQAGKSMLAEYRALQPDPVRRPVLALAHSA